MQLCEYNQKMVGGILQRKGHFRICHNAGLVCIVFFCNKNGIFDHDWDEHNRVEYSTDPVSETGSHTTAWLATAFLVLHSHAANHFFSVMLSNKLQKGLKSSPIEI